MKPIAELRSLTNRRGVDVKEGLDCVNDPILDPAPRARLLLDAAGARQRNAIALRQRQPDRPERLGQIDTLAELEVPRREPLGTRCTRPDRGFQMMIGEQASIRNTAT